MANPEWTDPLDWEDAASETDGRVSHSAGHKPGSEWEPATGYSDAFYQIGKMLGIPAQDKSPSEVWHEQMRPMLAQRLASQAELLEALRHLVRSVDDLIAESEGVYGLNLNGDPAPWDSLTEDWLIELERSRAAIARATGAA